MKIILEMANNHMGDVDHGLKLISELARVTADFEFDFFIKYQFFFISFFLIKGVITIGDKYKE